MHEEILIVDDKVQFCKSLGENLQDLGYRFQFATCTEGALSCLKSGTISMVLLDIVLGHEDGLSVLQQIRASWPRLPIVMITGYASISSAVTSNELGALDYIQKPVNIGLLSKLIDNAIESTRAPAAEGEPGPANASRIVTASPSMRMLIAKARRIAETNLPVLLCGENGTGKEVFADYIHAHSPRSARSLVKINCASFPESLLDNELFGHEKGAYTGADTVFRGVFERSHGGTLFLDEVADMLPAIQAKILRALQNNEVRRIGGNDTITIDVRFITATNKNIAQLVSDNGFREDLLPDERGDAGDPPLARPKGGHSPACRALPGGTVPRRSERPARQRRRPQRPSRSPLARNVRELKNTISYAASLINGTTIEATDLPPALLPPSAAGRPSESRAAPLDDVERLMIASTMRQYGNNKKRAAQALHISRNTLYSKLRKYGFNPDS